MPEKWNLFQACPTRYYAVGWSESQSVSGATNKLVEDCGCKLVSTEMHREELVRDAFIYEIRSKHLPQGIFEEETLDLQRAF